MKITKEELKQIIREEAIKFKKKIELEKELSEIQSQLDEVYAGDNMDSEKNDGVHAGQKKANFKTKNAGGFDALVEEEVNEESVMEEEVVNEELEEGIEEGLEEGLEESINIDEIFAEMDGEAVMEEGEVNEEVVSEDSVNEETVNEDLDEGMDENIAENLEEPMEGESVAQKAKKWDNNENMEKDTRVNESEEKEEGILTEEQVRMQELAGIKKIL